MNQIMTLGCGRLVSFDGGTYLVMLWFTPSSLLQAFFSSLDVSNVLDIGFHIHVREMSQGEPQLVGGSQVVDGERPSDMRVSCE